MNMKIINIVTILIILLTLVHTGVVRDTYEHLTKDMVKVNVSCTTDARGVTFCRDLKTGRSWTVNPSPVGTYIKT